MSVIPISKTVNSAELARVREVTPMRHFRARNDDEDTEARLVYNVQRDSIYCDRCEKSDDCTHTARVRLCGILTGSIRDNAGIERVAR